MICKKRARSYPQQTPIHEASQEVEPSNRIHSFRAPGHDCFNRLRGKLPGLLHTLPLIFLALLFVCVWASPSVAEDSDYPHNSVQNASCNTGTCHSNYYGGTAPYVTRRSVFYEAGCLYCHDDTNPAGSLAAPTAITHSSATTSTKYGTWTMKCIDCHHEHLQRQYWAYGEESHVVSGISDPGGTTTTTLTMTGAGWAENSLAGMVLFPNVEDFTVNSSGQINWMAAYNNYGIVGNTADTITVKGPMRLTEIGTGNKRFAVIYGNGINSRVPDELNSYAGIPQVDVKFFRPEGANSFADGNAVYDGICEVCHTKTTHHRKDGTAPAQSHFDGARCTTCHPHANGFQAVAFNHTTSGAVQTAAPCMECHNGPDPVADVHGNQCGLCHAAAGGGGPLVEPYETTAPQGGDCADCHGPLSDVHNHTASPGSGTVAIFDDNGHDDAGWVGDRPYFAVAVNCTLCHDTDLVTIHGSNCATCHPSPRNTLGTWNKGCQQGGCHASYHQDSAKAHSPFENTSDPANDCDTCHVTAVSGVDQSACLNCHATNTSGDTTPPVTATNALASYNGPAKIDFLITDNGKVGVGATFFKLNGGQITTGSHVFVNTAGSHTLEFWSIDQAGNIESPTNTVSFEVVIDTTPPTTTSNAKTSYSQGGVITLGATDDSILGVKATYYRLDNGAVQTGTSVQVPTTGGIHTYTLEFWSEDWAGNVESPKSVSFTVTSGTGTIRLSWGVSDLYGSPCSGDPDANAAWVIRRGSWSGPIVASGFGGCPNWSGVSDIAVQASPTPYFVIVDWWNSDEEYDDQTWFANVLVTTPGQIVVRRY